MNIENINDEKVRWFVEGTFSRFERINKRLWIFCIILFLGFILSNAFWIYRELQFEEITITQEATADGDSDIKLQNVGGDYYGGQSETNDQDQN